MGAISSRTAGGTQTLQGVYERSTPPEILINNSLGAVIFGVDTTANNTDNLLEFQNKSGTLNAYIRGDGLASFSSILYSPSDSTDWTSIAGSAPDDVFVALDTLADWAANLATLPTGTNRGERLIYSGSDWEVVYPYQVVTDISSDTSVGDPTGVYVFDSTGGDIQFELPQITSDLDGRILYFQKDSTDLNTITIVSAVGEDVGGDPAGQILMEENDVLTLVAHASDSEWQILSDNRLQGFVLRDPLTGTVYTNNLSDAGIPTSSLGNDSFDLQSQRAAGDYCAADDSVALGRFVDINSGGGAGGNVAVGSNITLSDGTSGPNIAIGSGVTIGSGISNVIAIGRNMAVPNPGSQAVIIGAQGSFGGDLDNAVGIGHAIGARDSTVAIGAVANPTGNNAICIGRSTTAPQNSVAIGRSATATTSNQIMIGAASFRLNMWITGNNSSTSSTTGALVVEGGVGIAEDVWTDGDLYINNDGVDVNQNLYFSEDGVNKYALRYFSGPESFGILNEGAGEFLLFYDTTSGPTLKLGDASSFPIEIQGSANTFTSPTDATSTITGAVIISGGVGIAKSLFIGDTSGTAITVLGIDAAGKVVDTGVSPTGIQKYTTDIGNSSDTSISVTHSLNTFDVTVTVYSNISFDIEYPTVTIDDADNITVTFDSAPAVDEYRVVVIG